MKVTKDTVVSIDYTLKNDAGEVIDSSEGQEPLSYVQGAGGIIPGLEREMDGKEPGEAFQVAISAADGYGDHNESLRQQVPRDQFEGVDDLELGMQFRVDSNMGQMLVTVVEIEGDTVTLDGNHPLAGMNLNFDITVREVREATESELEHGHAHGPGGHEH